MGGKEIFTDLEPVGAFGTFTSIGAPQEGRDKMKTIRREGIKATYFPKGENRMCKGLNRVEGERKRLNPLSIKIRSWIPNLAFL